MILLTVIHGDAGGVADNGVFTLWKFKADNYADLLTKVGMVEEDLAIVYASQGVWLINRKLKGVYMFQSGVWVYANQELQTEEETSQYKVKVDAADIGGQFLEDKIISNNETFQIKSVGPVKNLTFNVRQNVKPIDEAVDPTVNDDFNSTDGLIPPAPKYRVGQTWINHASGGVFIARDLTIGAAVWEPIASKEDAVNSSLMSGIITGLDVSINAGDNTKFDISAGTGIVVDWSTPSTPVFTRITFAGATAISITAGIGTNVFTALSIDSAGALQQSTGTQFTPQQRRQNIILDSLVHPNLTTISMIGISGILAYESADVYNDYIKALGAINKNNQYSANSNNLTVQKASGTTTLPWINKNVDLQNPSIQTNGLQAPLTSGSTSSEYQDGIGGFTFVPAFTVVDPDNYDDGSGVLVAVGNNKWTIQRFYFFGQTNGSLVTYGQAIYNSLSEAEAAIFSENPIISPLADSGTFRTALIVKKGATDLSDISQAKFVDIITQTSSISGVTVSWKPNSIPIGSILTSGASFFINGTGAGTGFYLEMDGGSNDRLFFNDSLNKAGAPPYDGTDLALKLIGRINANGGGGDNLKFNVNYSITKDGDNTQTTSISIAEQTVDVSSETQDIAFEIELGIMTGVVDASQVMVMVERHATGPGADTFTGSWEITGLEWVIK